jgi:hypothetical protein
MYASCGHSTMPQCATRATNAMPATTVGTRPRNNARRKVDDDSAYIGASGLGRKRVASDRLDPSADRAKRKRIDAAQSSITTTSAARREEGESRPLYVSIDICCIHILLEYIIVLSDGF